MRLDVARAHAAGVQRNDLVVEARKAALILADQRWIETTVSVPRNIKHHPLRARIDRLRARAVTLITSGPFRLIRQVNVHLGTEHPFGQRLLQLRRQTLKIQRRSSASLLNQPIQELPGNPIVLLLRHTPLLQQSPSYGSQTQNSLQAHIVYRSKPSRRYADRKARNEMPA